MGVRVLGCFWDNLSGRSQCMATVASYGSWKSPITAAMLTEETIGLGSAHVDGSGVYWAESRPEEAGRVAIVHRGADGKDVDLLPSPLNVRSRVHEYGGGSYCLADGMVYFSNYEDQQIYSVSVEHPPTKITNAPDHRFADYVFDENQRRLIGVREDHSSEGHEPTNEIVSIGLDSQVDVLVSGADFYASPRLSPDGSQLAWISWDHPNMPWDETSLWTADVHSDGSLGKPTCVASGESVCLPKWSPGGILHFVSDRSEWWNIYRFVEGQIECVYETDAEFAGPQWVFGNSEYVFLSEDHLICTYTRGGRWYLAHLYADRKALENIDLPYDSFGGLQIYDGVCYFLAGTGDDFGQFVRLDVESVRVEVIRKSGKLSLDKKWISIAEAVIFPTGGDMVAHAFYYAPNNPDYEAPTGECPPVIVMVHGGPTGSTSTAFALAKQFWTSRGFAILDVNYRGSTGYGRAYRDALKRQWGVVDVEDVAHGVRYLVEQGKADAEKVIIRGGSAGGYTVLITLALQDVFKAGTSLYGISDLELLAHETHKFESRYLDQVIGPYPEMRDVYIERSPKSHLDKYAKPTLFLQGLEDKVVPPNQAEEMVDVLKEKGIPVAYLAFEGEGHGFRKSETIERAITAELYFYAQVFGFELAEYIEPIEIDNLNSE